jgi:hypothetical protein
MNRLTLEALLTVLDWDLPDELLPYLLAERYRYLTLGHSDDFR